MNAAFCFLDDPEENKFTGTTIQENNELNKKREKKKWNFKRRVYKISARRDILS